MDDAVVLQNLSYLGHAGPAHTQKVGQIFMSDQKGIFGIRAQVHHE
jgi:hypothetical protein